MPTLETLDFTIRIDSTPTFSYFDLYLYSAYAAPIAFKSKFSHITFPFFYGQTIYGLRSDSHIKFTYIDKRI